MNTKSFSVRLIACFALLLLFIGGCGLTRHEGRIEIFDAKGESTGSYVATLDRPMLMEVTDKNGVTVKADSRGTSGFGDFLKGILEIVTLGLIMNK